MNMPWSVGEKGSHGCSGYPVVKDGTNEVEGCHDTREKANRQLAALYANEPEARAQLKVASINDLPDSAFAYIEPGGSKDEQGKTVPRSKRHFPIHDAAHVRNALARAPQSPFGAKAMPKIRAAAKKFGIQMADDRSQSIDLVGGPVEFRDASVSGVNFDQRLIEVIAVPYEEPAMVEYRGEIWEESFSRGSFDGIETRQDQIRVNRNHDKTMTIGKVLSWWPSRAEGLVGSVRVAPTARGDETLALANEDMLSLSAGFAVRGRDQVLDKQSMTRRINKAFIDHLSFVESPAYGGAKVLSVRDRTGIDDRPQLDTPNLDELIAFMNSRRG